MKITDKAAQETVVSRREVTGTLDDGSIIRAVVEGPNLVVTYQDATLGSSTLFVPVAKVQDVAAVLQTLKTSQ